uniref:DNA pilot protein n=2 Tax=Dulem virus 235 TaxID=3145712 RepID=A0AAU8B364_9VIRU
MAYVPKLEVPSIRTPPMPTSLPKPSIIPNNSFGMLPLIPSLVAGIGSIAGSAIGAISQSKANKANYRLMQEQNAYNEKMWNLNNAYNTPLMQRQRLEEAGINPALALSNISTGVAQGAVTSAPAPNLMPTIQGNPLAGAGSAFTSMYSTLKQNELLDAQVAKTQAEAKSIAQLTENTLTDSGVQRKVWQTNIDSMNLTMSQLKEMFPAQKQYLNSQIDAIAVKMDLDKTVAQLNLSQLHLNSYQEKRLKAEIVSIYSSAAYMVQAGKLSEAQANLMSEKLITERSVRYGINLENSFNARSFGSRLYGLSLENGLLNSRIRNTDANTGLQNKQTSHIGFEEKMRMLDFVADQYNKHMDRGVKLVDGLIPF